MRKLIFSMTIAALFTSCAGNKEEKTEGEVVPSNETAPAQTADASYPRSFTTKSGQTVTISEAHPMGMSMSDITVSGIGFSDSIFLKDENPVSSVLEGDLDQDGFSEYYIITTAAGSGSYGNIIGVASIKDNSFARIAVADFKDATDYMGRDSFRIEGNRIIRRYPAYKEKDTNATPTGGTTEIAYELKKSSEGNYSLDIIKK